jgi:hypothetical protein
MGVDYFQPHTLQSKPKIVVYSQTFGRSAFAILENMTVYTETRNLAEMSKDLLERMKQMGASEEDIKDSEEKMKPSTILLNKIEAVENWLKENNCAEIINDENKKINWV